MKSLIVLSLVLTTVYGLSEQFQKDVKIKLADVAATCIPEVGANEADITELMNHKHPSRREGKCLISCFQKKFGLQGDDGLPNREGTLRLIEPINAEDPELYKKLIQIALICGPLISEMSITDHCDAALEIASCALTEGKKIGVIDPFMTQGSNLS